MEHTVNTPNRHSGRARTLLAVALATAALAVPTVAGLTVVSTQASSVVKSHGPVGPTPDSHRVALGSTSDSVTSNSVRLA